MKRRPPSSRPTIAEMVRPGLLAVRRLWLPFLMIQCCALALVITYFHSESIRQACGRLADIKRAGGYLFSAVTLGFASGCMPEAFKFIAGTDRSLSHQRRRNTVFNFCLYCVIGVIVDAFYRLMAATFGDTATIAAVAAKVVCDQLIFSPIIGTTGIAIAYTLRECRYRPLTALKELGPQWYLSRAMPLIIPSWVYWFPMTCLMYSLPASLTFVFGAFASAACATVVIAVAEQKAPRAETASPTSPVPLSPAVARCRR